MPIDELNQHIGLTPANIVAVDYRNADEIIIHFIDPFAGLSATIWNEQTDAKFPAHFKFDNRHKVDFNFPLIAGFVQEGRSNEFCEVHIKGTTRDEPVKFDIQNISILSIGELYQQFQGNMPKLYYTTIHGHHTAIITPHKTDQAEFAKTIVDLKTRAKRPGSEGAQDKKGPGQDGGPPVA